MGLETNWMEKGWSALGEGLTQPEAVTEGEKKKVVEAQAAERDADLQALVACFRGPSGLRALQYLRSRTVEIACFDPSVQGENALYHGFFREGQNSVVRLIEDIISHAEKE